MESRHTRKFISTNEVTIDDVLNVLEQWEENLLSDEDVIFFAESLYDLGPGWPVYPRSDKRSVLFGALDALAMLYVQPTLKSDIPALKAFLALGQVDPLPAWELLEQYWSNIDWNARLKIQTDGS
jgi:hypothetical protein